MFFKINTNKEVVRENTGGGNYINTTGIYDVTIIAPFISQSEESESITVDFLIEYKGVKQPLYGNLRLTNKDGNENKIGVETFNKLLIVTDTEEVADPEPRELPIGKEGALKEVPVLEDLTNKEVKVKIVFEYGVYNNSIIERKIIRTFYRAEDGASAEEIVNDTEKGKHYEKDLKYIEESKTKGIVYKDDLTPEDVEEWIKNKRPKGTVGNSSGTKKAPSFTKKAPSFSKK